MRRASFHEAWLSMGLPSGSVRNPLAVSLGAVLAVTTGTAFGQGIDRATALAGWRAAVDRVSTLQRYHLRGRSIARTFEAKTSEGAQELTWDSDIQDKRYKVTWVTTANGSTAKHSQSFDGAVWYGLTENMQGASGTICEHPETSLEVNPDRHLELQAGGAFYVRLQDFLERPVNMGGVAWLDKLEANDRYLTASAKGNEVTLTLPDDVATRLKLPVEITLEMHEDVFVPTTVRVKGQSGDRDAEIVTHLADISKAGEAYYPRKITETTSDGTRRSGLHPVFSVEFTLSAEVLPATSADFYRLAFQKGTRLFDDRLPAGQRMTKAMTGTKPTGEYAAPMSATSNPTLTESRSMLQYYVAGAVVLVGCAAILWRLRLWPRK